MRRSVLQSLRLSALTAALAIAGTASTPAWAVSYQYDALGRVTKVTYDDGSCVVYAYDANGNRITVNAYKPCPV